MAQGPPVGWVTVESFDPPLSITARMAEERPSVESGYGGWDEVERPRRSPLTTFKSQPALHLSLPLLIDEWVDGVSIEWQIDQVERMGQPTAADGEPPQLHVRATGGAVPYRNRTWVVGDISWGDALMNDGGDRVRQQLTLTLIEYVEDVHLVERSAANRKRAKAKVPKKKRGAKSKRVVVKKKAKPTWTRVKTTRGAAAVTAFGDGEDLLAIAARELGDADRWLEIAQLNGLRDPRAIPAGTVIRLP